MEIILLTLDKYYPAGGQVADEIKLADLKTTQREDVLFAMAKLPYSSTEKPVVIYRQLLANGEIEYRTISAKCPHQGADISLDELKPDGNVYCSLHRRPICIFSEYNRAYLTVKRGDDFYIIKN
ncbi:MAG: nitrite reductase/ring-hydroxylating ferredoxin subunit [Colwellia sp.]